jgi:hypothetical protein
MDIDDYCLSDLPLQPIITQTNEKIDDINRNESDRQFNSQISLNKKSTISIDTQQLLTEKFECLFFYFLIYSRRLFSILVNLIANTIEQFVPHSDIGRAMKQRIYNKKVLPIIK